MPHKTGPADKPAACRDELNQHAPVGKRAFGQCFVLVSLTVLALFGCGRMPNGHVRVTGEVLMPDGSPFTLGSARVGFEPADLATRETSTGLGVLDDQGRYEIMTSDANEGVPLGDYKVVLYVKGTEAELVLANASGWGEA